MIGGLISAGTFAAASMSGVDELAGALARYAVKLTLRSKQVDTDAGEEMVAQMRADAPQLSGNLINGITTFPGTAEGLDAVVVEASAVRPGAFGGWDYAAFVEIGTSNMESEPFFYTDAERVLEERGSSLDEAIGALGSEEGFA